MKYAFVQAQTRAYPVRVMCRVLEISEPGSYAWRKRPDSRRFRQNRELMDHVQVVFEDNRRRYGSPRVYRELRARNRQVVKKLLHFPLPRWRALCSSKAGNIIPTLESSLYSVSVSAGSDQVPHWLSERVNELEA